MAVKPDPDDRKIGYNLIWADYGNKERNFNINLKGVAELLYEMPSKFRVGAIHELPLP
jgi:hypothetical protein